MAKVSSVSSYGGKRKYGKGKAGMSRPVKRKVRGKVSRKRLR